MARDQAVQPEVVQEEAAAPRSHIEAAGRRLLRFAVRQPVAALFAIVVLVMIVVAIFAPWIATHDPLAIDPRARLLDPSREHYFGTDSLGRDVFSRVVYGARVSLIVGIGATLAGTLLGSLIGLVSGYLGGIADTITQRIMDGLQAIPSLIFLLLVAAIWKQGMISVVLILSVLIAPYAGRVVRGVVLSVREETYVLAARAIGASSLRIMAFHIFPNVQASIIVICSITIGGAILVEGALSFLGLGIPPDDPTWKTSWGAMLRPDNLQYMQQAPLLALFPGAAITLAVLAFNMLGDALRDVLDPRLRGAG